MSGQAQQDSDIQELDENKVGNFNTLKEKPYPILFNFLQSGSTISNNESIVFSTLQQQEKLILQLISSFKKQLGVMQDYFHELDQQRLIKIIETSISKLFLYKPKAISLELTYDKSVYFTVIFDNQNLYFELFFENEIGEFVEAVINIYKNKVNTLSYNGNLNNAFKALDKVFNVKA